MAWRAFLFGKLPTHGDFVSRGLDDAVRERWDAWASAEIAGATEALGDARFAAAHDNAPVCQFLSGPGELGDGWRAGALAPSIDASGRRFVIVVGLDGLSAGEAAVLGLGLCDLCEGGLRRALVEGLDADASLALLAGAAPSAGQQAAAAALGATPASVGVWWRPDDGTMQEGAEPPAGFLQGSLCDIAAGLTAQ